jgi:hypothetical protein
LFYAPAGKGFPIGNLTSQLFGNIYLNELDHFIKKDICINYYGRYVDDFVLVHPDKQYLLQCRNTIQQFLKEKLTLNLHPRKFYLQHFTKGVPFLGVFIKPFRLYIGKRAKYNFFDRVEKWNSLVEDRKGELKTENLELFRAQVNSYLGICSHYSTYKLRRKMIANKLDRYFEKYFYFPPDFKKITLRRYPKIHFPPDNRIDYLRQRNDRIGVFQPINRDIFV